MRSIVGWIGMIVFLAVYMSAPAAWSASGKVALVIGNAAYSDVAPLKNPVNDATDIAAALNEMGFDVILKLNVGIETFSDALDEFEQLAERSDVAVIFYAGHGLEFESRNYLVPVDALLERESQIRHRTLELDRLEAAVSGARKLRMVFLDACRNNPFADRIQTRGRKRSLIGRGLARVEPTDGTVVAYSAKGGTTASDGEGRNSPYTAALLRYMREPNLDVDRLLRKVRDDVLRETNREQEPFNYGSLPAETVSLNLVDMGGKPETAVAGGHEPAKAEPAQNAAKEAWDAIKDTQSRSDLETIVRLFPDTIYATFAKARMAEMDTKPATTQEIASLDGGRESTTINLPGPASWFLAIYPNVDFYGGDLLPSGIRAESAEQCASVCGNEIACKMFTYNTRANRCFLKSGYEVAQRASDAVGGLFYKGTKDQPRLVRTEWEFLNAADIAAPDIGATRDADYTSCFASCRGNSQCQGISFIGRLKRDRCWLKTGSVANTVVKKGVMSARRVDYLISPYLVVPANSKD